MPKSLVVWRFSDGKPGHMKQTDGLLQGLEQIAKLSCHEVAVGESTNVTVSEQIKKLDSPMLLIGAGHATHIPMIWSRLRFDCKTVVLMKPSLPASWFDMVLLPQHDRSYSLGNVVRTEVSLCPIVRDVQKEHDLGVILVGGESRHYGWDEAHLTDVISKLVAGHERTRWEIFDSRRTAEGFLRRLNLPHSVKLNHHSDIPEDYLANRLARATFGWVTCDSVSMVHEAIANRLRVCVIEMPLKKKNKGNKIERAVDSLVAHGLVVRDSHVTQTEVSAPSTLEDFNLKYARAVYDRLL